MGPVDPHKRLMRRSAAYRAYIDIDALPANAPGFEVDCEDQPKVHIAEHFCRMPLLDGTLCGRKHASRYLLDQHLRGAHKAAPKNQRHHDAAMIEAADEFYCALMKGYEWPDYEEGDDNTSAATTLLKLEQRTVEVTDDQAENDIALTTTALRQRKSRIADLSDDNLGESSEQQDTSPPHKRGNRPQKPQSSQLGVEQDLELELKKTRIQKQMHAAELREIELEQALLTLRKRNTEASTA